MDNPGLNGFNLKAPGFMPRFLIAYWVVFSSGNLDLRGQTEIVVGSTNSIVATAFDHKTADLYAIWKDSVRVFKAPDYLESKFFPIPKLEGFEIGVYKPLVANATLYFIHIMGGLVYRLDSDSLRQIDRSFNHRMQINSSMLVKNDTIFRYGGYGFWSYRNFFTFFSNSSLEWEIVLPHGKQEVPQGVSDAAITYDEENTYVFGGHYRLPYELYDGTFYDKIWQYNWPGHKWELLGSLHHDFSSAYSQINMGDRVLYYLSQRLLAVVDPASNLVRNYMLPDARIDVACPDGICDKPNNLTWLIDGFYKDGNFYLPFFYAKNPSDSRKSAGTIVYKIIPESEFLVTLVTEKPLYASNKFPVTTAAVILLTLGALGGSLLFYRRKKRQNIILILDDGLTYKGQKTPLDTSSIALLKLLIASKGEASAQEVLELVENPSLSDGHNLKLRAQLVDNINLSLNWHLRYARFTALTLGVSRFRLLFYCLLWCGFSVVAQSFKVGNITTLKATAFDPETQNIYAIWKDSLRIHIAPDYKESILTKLETEPDLYPLFPNIFHALFLKGRLYFVHRGDGLVLEVTGDSLKKIDRSTQLKMQNSSAVFVQNDTIFRFGGGGFWTFWNYLTYFDPTSKEWEIILPESTDQAVPGLTNLLVSHSEDKIFVFSGRLQDKINPINSHQNHEVWSFDKKQNRWELKGTSSLLFGGESLIAHMGSRVLVQLNNEFILLDPENNRASYHRRLPVLGNLIDNRVIKSFYNKSVFFIVHYKTLFAGASLDRELVYEVVSESDFLGEPYKVEPLFEEFTFPKSWVISGIGIIAFVLGIVIRRKRKGKAEKIRVTSNGISYANETIVLGKEEAALLHLLLRQNGIASSEEIIALTGGRSLNDSQKQKEKNRVVTSLNLSMRSLLNEDRDLIQVLQSAKDRRIKNYTLDISKFKLH